MTGHSFAVTNRHEKCISEAISQAELSPCFHKHGCVISGSGRIVGRGYNNYRTRSNDGLLANSCTCHAEVAAIRSSLRGGRSRVKQRERGNKAPIPKPNTLCG